MDTHRSMNHHCLKSWFSMILMAAALTACSPAAAAAPTALPPAAPAAVQPLPTSAPTATALSTPFSITEYPAEGYGPSNFPAGVNPLTGLPVANPALLERRPLVIKVENLPRADRPQFGLSAADIVYEYYTEQGTTRFAALFYGQDAAQVGPIRSARFFDANLIRMYKAVFAFGSAYEGVLTRFYSAEFADRLVVEGAQNCPPMCRFEPEGRNYLMTDTGKLSAYITSQNVSNGRQNLDGMFFQKQVPGDGKDLAQLYVRYSGAVYNRWDYDPGSGRYMRWVDQDNAIDPKDEVYAQLVDRANQQPIAFDNLVVLEMKHDHLVRTADMEVVDMQFNSMGKAYVFRDGKAYEVRWQRLTADAVVSLIDASGKPFPLKPGTTWFEVLGASSTLDTAQPAWRFVHIMP